MALLLSKTRLRHAHLRQPQVVRSLHTRDILKDSLGLKVFTGVSESQRLLKAKLLFKTKKVQGSKTARASFRLSYLSELSFEGKLSGSTQIFRCKHVFEGSALAGASLVAQTVKRAHLPCGRPRFDPWVGECRTYKNQCILTIPLFYTQAATHSV